MTSRLYEFNNFLFERGIVGIMMGTIAGFAVTNLVKDIKTSVLIPLLNRTRFKFLKFPLVSSMIEFLVIMLFIYGLYHILLYPWFKVQIENEKKEKNREKEWKNELLDEIKNVDLGSVYM